MEITSVVHPYESRETRPLRSDICLRVTLSLELRGTETNTRRVSRGNNLRLIAPPSRFHGALFRFKDYLTPVFVRDYRLFSNISDI